MLRARFGHGVQDGERAAAHHLVRALEFREGQIVDWWCIQPPHVDDAVARQRLGRGELYEQAAKILRVTFVGGPGARTLLRETICPIDEMAMMPERFQPGG